MLRIVTITVSGGVIFGVKRGLCALGRRVSAGLSLAVRQGAVFEPEARWITQRSHQCARPLMHNYQRARLYS